MFAYRVGVAVNFALNLAPFQPNVANSGPIALEFAKIEPNLGQAWPALQHMLPGFDQGERCLAKIGSDRYVALGQLWAWVRPSSRRSRGSWPMWGHGRI